MVDKPCVARVRCALVWCVAGVCAKRCVGQDSGCVGSKWRLDSMRGQSKCGNLKCGRMWCGQARVRCAHRVAMWRTRNVWRSVGSESVAAVQCHTDSAQDYAKWFI